MSIDLSMRRRHRAAVARQLAERLSAEAIAEDRSIDWGMLSTAPDWCACDATERRELQLLTGAVYLHASLRRCMQGAALKRLATLIGTPRLDAIRLRPYAVAHERDADDEALADAVDLDALLLHRGRNVLAATLRIDDPARTAFVALLDAPTDGGRSERSDDEPIPDAERYCRIGLDLQALHVVPNEAEPPDTEPGED